MTKDDIDRMVGRTVRDHSDNERAIICIERQLRTFADAIKQYVEEISPGDFDDIPSLVKEAPDPREQFQELLRRYSKRGEFREFLDRHGIRLPRDGGD